MMLCKAVGRPFNGNPSFGLLKDIAKIIHGCRGQQCAQSWIISELAKLAEKNIKVGLRTFLVESMWTYTFLDLYASMPKMHFQLGPKLPVPQSNPFGPYPPFTRDLSYIALVVFLWR